MIATPAVTFEESEEVLEVYAVFTLHATPRDNAQRATDRFARDLERFLAHEYGATDLVVNAAHWSMRELPVDA